MIHMKSRIESNAKTKVMHGRAETCVVVVVVVVVSDTS